MGGVIPLDDAGELGARDPGGALDAVLSLPDQIEHWVSSDPPPGRASRTALVCGMGGSGVAGDLAAALATGGPVVAHHGYGVPGWCGPETFVVASSYSGNTEETLSAMRAASEAGAPGCAVASGGALIDQAARLGWSTILVPGGTMPRYAIGHLTVATLLPLASGPRPFLAPLGERLPSVALHLRERIGPWGPGTPEVSNTAKRIARQLDGCLPVVWGGPGVTGVASGRWRTDLNENAKVPAHSAVLPELDHNEIVGLGADGRDERPDIPVAVVCLREPDADPRVAARFQSTTEEVRGSVTRIIEVEAQGPDPLTRFLDLTMLGGLVSVYLAVIRGVDPSTIAAIDRLKQTLTGS